jgi:drug/metabolite transporter (DMT)-like permease
VDFIGQNGGQSQKLSAQVCVALKEGAHWCPLSFLSQDSVMLAKPTLGNWISVFALGVIWGASFMAVSIAIQGFGPLTVAAARISLAAVALVGVAYYLGQPLPSFRDGEGRRIWIFASAMGLFSNALPFFLLSWAQQHVASGFAGITMAIVPLFTLGMAHFLVPGERLTPQKVTGFGMGLLGVVVLIGPSAMAATGGAAEDVARLVCIAAAASYAVGSIITRRCPPVGAVAFSAAALVAGTVIIVPIAMFAEGMPTELPSALPWLALLYLGLGPTALATLLLVKVIRTAGPGFLSQVNFHVPVWSVIFGTVLLSETLPAQFLAALGLIMVGQGLSRARLWRRRP